MSDVREVTWVDWRSLPPLVQCHCCGAIRNNHHPKPPDLEPNVGAYAELAPINPLDMVGWFAHVSDGLVWCSTCWQREGFARYHG